MSGPDDNPRVTSGVVPGRVSWGPRLFGPLALIAVLIALFAVITTSGGDTDGEAPSTSSVPQQKQKKPGSGAVNPKSYVVESGDTLTAIAAEFDVSTKRLLRLNPGIDPQALATGTELKIR